MRRHASYILSRRSFVLFFILAAFYCFGAEHSMAADEGKAAIKGKVTDAEGRAVEGAMVFVYNSTNVKRAADFISARTDPEGMYLMVVPAGRYWLMARSKSAGDYGPLMLKDRHSGDPRETELLPDTETVIDFVVADLMEAMKMKREERERPLKITGRILDEKGAPVHGAYAVANRKKETSGIPDYMSAWVDREGRFTMYVPRGRYFIGGAVSFPPGKDYSLDREADIAADTSMEITIKTPVVTSD